MKILFVCKKRVNSYGNSFGLYNSARLVAEALEKIGIESKVVMVVDNNCIDREVHQYDPTHIIIEALWVVPAKFHVLLKLHPHRQWIVRLHSKTPFLSMEGIAVNWLRKYAAISALYNNFYVAANNDEFCGDLMGVFDIPCLYQPNIYHMNRLHWSSYIRKGFRHHKHHHVDIGCFGAIRPFKNQLAQAFAAIRFADEIGMSLRFHINYDRLEQRGEEVLKNLRSTFPIRGHELVEHEWVSHPEFLKIVEQMDLGLQVSMTESFNIVAADFVFQNVPIVVCPDISWMSSLYMADPDDTDSMINGLRFAWSGSRFSLQSINMRRLLSYNKMALEAWIRSFGDSVQV